MDLDQLYFNFENRFRGNRDHVINSLNIYDGSIKYCKRELDGLEALDIGCGRGEWLEKLSHSGFNCLGIETNESMVRTCRELGLNILHGDALNSLKSLPDKKFSLISMFHVIEHLENNYIKQIFCECKRLICPGGLLLIETPSIDNLIVSSKTFHLDSTHINKINPDNLIYSLESTGFDFARYYFINSGPLSNAHPQNLTRVLNGVAQDLSVIASNSNVFDKDISIEKSLIEESIDKGLTTLDAATEFDSSLRLTDQRIINNELALFELRKKIMIIEDKYEHINNIYNFFYNSLPVKLLRVLKKIVHKIINLIILNLKYILNFFLIYFPRLNILGFLKFVRKSDIIISIIIALMRRVGMQRQAYMLPLTFKKVNKSESNSCDLNFKLLNNFNTSSRAKDIYKKIKSRRSK